MRASCFVLCLIFGVVCIGAIPNRDTEPNSIFSAHNPHVEDHNHFVAKEDGKCPRDYGKCYADRLEGSECTPWCCECKKGLLCQNGQNGKINSGSCQRVNGRKIIGEEGCDGKDDDCGPGLKCVSDATGMCLRV